MATTTHDNIASQKAPAKNGFVPIGPAELSGRPGTWYERDRRLTPGDPPYQAWSAVFVMSAG